MVLKDQPLSCNLGFKFIEIGIKFIKIKIPEKVDGYSTIKRFTILNGITSE